MWLAAAYLLPPSRYERDKLAPFQFIELHRLLLARATAKRISEYQVRGSLHCVRSPRVMTAQGQKRTTDLMSRTLECPLCPRKRIVNSPPSHIAELMNAPFVGQLVGPTHTTAKLQGPATKCGGSSIRLCAGRGRRRRRDRGRRAANRTRACRVKPGRHCCCRSSKRDGGNDVIPDYAAFGGKADNSAHCEFVRL
jgi:hypothetical protein